MLKTGYIFLLIVICISCSNYKKMVRNTFAYTIVKTPGNIKVDRNGIPLTGGADTFHLVYVEIKGDTMPAWDYAWKNNKTYSLKVFPILQKQLEVGKDKTNGEQITITVGPENTLYQLVMEPSNEKIQSPQILAKGEILLQGNYKNKKFTQKISNTVELFQLPTE